MPHTHPSDENITVISGTLHQGIGDRFDRAKTEAIPTGNTFLTRPSNVAALLSLLELTYPNKQVVRYDQGVGTATSKGQAKKLGQELDYPALEILEAPLAGWRPRAWNDRFKGLLFGEGLDKNVAQMYAALAELYEEGDRLFLFGFSRGAFTVRALAGLLHRCHLPHKGEYTAATFEHAWSVFKVMDPKQCPEAIELIRNRHRGCPVHFVGLWDTVKSYGGLIPVMLPHLRHNPDVTHIRHALALDERRAWFKPTTWGLLDSDECGAMTREEFDRGSYKGQANNIREVWFSGCHSDVGGGEKYRRRNRRHHRDSTAPLISLRWMLGEAANLDEGPLILNEKGLRFLSQPDPTPEIRQSWNRRWRAIERMPRKEIDNSRQYPGLVPHWGSDGVRDPNMSRRHGKVLVHGTVGDQYPEGLPIVYCETKGPPAR